MAIFLRDLYYDTKRKYNLNLISGGKGKLGIHIRGYIHIHILERRGTHHHNRRDLR